MRFRPPSINLVESKQLEQFKPVLQPLEPYSLIETPTGQSNINEYEIILQDVSKLSQSKKSFLQNERRMKVRKYLEKKRQRQYKVFVNKNKRKVAVQRKRIMGRFISKVDQQKIDKAFNLYDSKNNLKIEGLGSVIEQNNLGYKYVSKNKIMDKANKIVLRQKVDEIIMRKLFNNQQIFYLN